MAEKMTFRDLKVWQKAIELAKEVYAITRRMPDSEKFGLTNQMRRAAVSIPSNIAEGNARRSRNDYIHFLTMARGSLAELETQWILARELKFLLPDDTLTETMLEVSRMLQGLIASLRRRESN